jgi:hypothetical protein
VHEFEGDCPIRSADADIHRARPVHADAGLIRLDEVVELARDLDGEAIVVRESVRLTEDGPMLAPRQFPRVLDVGILRPHLEEVPLLVGHASREPQPADRIDVPIDRRIVGAWPAIRIARHVRAAAEKVEFVLEHALRCREGRLDAAAMALSKLCDRLRGHARIQCAAFPPPPAPVGR